MPGVILEKIEFPSCPALDEVLANDMSDPAIANSADYCDDPVRSITNAGEFPDSFATDPIFGYSV